MRDTSGRYVAFRSSRVHYLTWGTGPRFLFAFHGYGESAVSFAFIGDALDPRYTLIAIDLPFHGLTEWKEGLGFRVDDLLAIMASIAGNSARPWSLLGYSMGGRIALGLFQDHPDRFDRLVLAAPDGMTVNPWYWLATATRAGNVLFRWSMRRPGWLFLVLRLGNRLGLVNPSIFKFAVHYIDDRAVRRELYIRWTATRKFRPRPRRIAALVRTRRVPVHLVYGKFDRIIRWERGEKFRVRCPADCHLSLIEAGHQLLRPQYLPVLLPLFA